MATISYKCDTCKRGTELIENQSGFTIIGKCNITEGCLGRLYRTARNPNNVRESSPTFVDGLANFTPRRALFEYSQTLPSNSWEVTHNMGVLPATFVYVYDSNNILTYLKDEEYNVTPDGKNKITLNFDQRYQGIVQCVARSTVPQIPNTIAPPDNTFQVSSNGLLTIAVPKFITYTSGVNIGQTLKVCEPTNSVKIDIEISKPNEEAFVCTETVGNILDNRSPWNGWSEIMVAKRKNYCVRTIDILKMKVFGTAILKASDVPNGTRMRFLAIDYGDGIKRAINTRSVLALLAKSPYQYVDKIQDQLVDIGEMMGSTPDYFIYNDGEISIDETLVEKTYPDIIRVIPQYNPPKPTPSASRVTPTPTASTSHTPSPTPSVTASATAPATPTPTPSTSAPIKCGIPAVITGNGARFPSYNSYQQELGTDPGYVLFGFATGRIPDKMEIWANGSMVYNTGYWGDAALYQTQLDSVLAANNLPPEVINNTTGTTTADYEWFTFFKDNTYSRVEVRIYSPLSNGGFGFIINCPDPNPSPTPTPVPSVTPTPSMGNIGIVSAGSDSSSICGTTVPLEGSISGGSGGPYAILWEQISGPAVVINDPTALVTYFTYTSSTDRTFRLWVNKGQFNQAFDDVTVFGTPSDQVDVLLEITTSENNPDIFIVQPYFIEEVNQ